MYKDGSMNKDKYYDSECLQTVKNRLKQLHGYENGIVAYGVGSTFI